MASNLKVIWGIFSIKNFPLREKEKERAGREGREGMVRIGIERGKKRRGTEEGGGRRRERGKKVPLLIIFPKNNQIHQKKLFFSRHLQPIGWG